MAQIPVTEPIEIDAGAPQFFFDDYIVDNHWAVRHTPRHREEVVRHVHALEKVGAPVIADDGGFLTVLRDDLTGTFRMWYQKSFRTAPRATLSAIAYAESLDGKVWHRPDLGVYPWPGPGPNNVVWPGLDGAKATGPFILEIPGWAKRGSRFVMLYKGRTGRGRAGLFLARSDDGITWIDHTKITDIASDTQNAIVHRPTPLHPNSGEFLLFSRAAVVRRRGRGYPNPQKRRIARMVSVDPWGDWDLVDRPRTILAPTNEDSANDFNHFYGMVVKRYANIFWGFLWPHRMNDFIHTELTFSRDGLNFERFPRHPQLLARGNPGDWDYGMVFAGMSWVELGDEWLVYYAGSDQPHNVSTRRTGIGLATIRREGFVSMRGPTGGGHVVTRAIRWPGGELFINANARIPGLPAGRVEVRLRDIDHNSMPGFEFADCGSFVGDSVSHRVTCLGGPLDLLAGRVVRVEFFLQDADLFTFRAE